MSYSGRLLDVSVILVNYNTYKLTSECIDSIFKHTKTVSFEVIVVDNASTDESRECFQKDTRIRYIYNKENIGFGRANNIGMQVAKGMYFFLLNTDTLLLNDALSYFVSYEKKHGNNSVIGCWLIDGAMHPNKSYGRFPTILSLCSTALKVYTDRIKSKMSFRKQSLTKDDINEVKSVDYIMGADIFLPRDVWSKTHGFDEVFFMYYEETEWQFRMNSLNIPRLVIPGPQIIHYDGGSQVKDVQSKRNINRQYRLYNGMFIYVRKRYSWPLYYFFRVVYFILRSLPILFLPISWNEKKRYFQAILQPIGL